MKMISALFTSGVNYRLLWKRYWWWFPLVLLLCLLHSSHPLDSDEGVTLNGAWEILQHRRLYLDFFEFIPPGSFYLLAGWWHLLPVSYLSAIMLALLLTIVSGAGIYRLTQRLGVEKWQWLPVLLFFLSSVFWRPLNHNAFALPFLIWSVVTYHHALNSKTKSLAFFAAGLLAGITCLFLQHKGLALLATYFVYSVILITKKKISLLQLTMLLVGITLPIALLCLWRSPSLLFNHLILFPLHNYPETNVVSFTPWIYATVIACLLYIYLRFVTKHTQLLFLLILQLVLLLSVVVRTDLSHLVPLLFPLYILISLTLQQVCKLYKISVSLIALIIYGTIAITLSYLQHYPVLTTSNPALYKAVATLCPKDSLYAGPFMPGLYFEFKKTNHLPYSILITRQQTEDQFAEAARLLAANPPQCAVLNYDIVEKFGYTTNNPVDAFFARHYRLAEKFPDNTLIYVLK